MCDHTPHMQKPVSQMTLGYLDCNSNSAALLGLFLYFDASIFSTVAFLPWETQFMFLSWFLLTLPKLKRDHLFYWTAYAFLLLVLIGVIWVMFLGRISLSSVLLLLVLNFMSGCRLELMYISLIVNVRPRLTHLHDFQLIVLLPWLLEIPFLVCIVLTE